MFATNSLYRGFRIDNLESTNRFLKAKGIDPFSVDEVQTEMKEEHKRQTTLHRAVIARKFGDVTEYRKGDGWTPERKAAEVFKMTEAGIGAKWCDIYDEDPNNRILLWVEPETGLPDNERERINQYLQILTTLATKKRARM
jgi:hypothetical protein